MLVFRKGAAAEVEKGLPPPSASSVVIQSELEDDEAADPVVEVKKSVPV